MGTKSMAHEEVEYYQVILYGQFSETVLLDTQDKAVIISLAERLREVFSVEKLKLDIGVFQHVHYFDLDENGRVLDEKREITEVEF